MPEFDARAPGRGCALARRFMWPALATACVVALIAAGGFAAMRMSGAGRPREAVSVGQAAPDFTLKEAGSGKPVRISDYRGRTVVLNFWATWCGPCRFELPALEQAFRQRGDADFVVLAVNVGETDQAVAAFRREFRMSFPVVLDTQGAVQAAYGDRTLPQTYFIDRAGIVRGRHIGSMSATELARGLAFAEDP